VIDFIDAHVYPPVAAFWDGPLHPYRSGLEAHLGRSLPEQSAEELADYYRLRDARAVVLGWDSEAMTNRRPLSSKDVAAVVAAAPDVFIGFGAADPMNGAGAVGQVHEAAGLGMAGIAFQPHAQGIGPGDRYAAPVWEATADHDLICLIETGFPTLGAGGPGGLGVRLEHGHPIHVDGLAAEYPDLRIVMAHSGSLWLDQAVAVALHKTNVWLDLSGQPPHAMPPILLDAIRGPLADRVIFGSGYPFGSPDVWLWEWGEIEVSDDVRIKVRRDNAAELLRQAPQG
jgi:predicted TIM-barrel fold metal-dependent hydrolase